MSILFPENHTFDSLFRELAHSVKDMAVLFQELSIDFKNFKDYSLKAKIIEEQADSVTHKIIHELNTAFITPYDREDLYALVLQLDDIVDYIENAVHNFHVYDVHEKRSCVDEFAPLFVEASENIIKLMKACFAKKRHLTDLSKIIVAIHTQESRGDEIYLDAIHELFRNEKNAIEVIKWKDIIENLEQAMDKFENTANTVENINIKAS